MKSQGNACGGPSEGSTDASRSRWRFGLLASVWIAQRILMGLFLGTLASASAAPVRTLTLRGPATNITAEVTGTLTLALSIDGEKVSATMKAEAPLTGSGSLTGRYAGGWCELKGQLAEGFQFQLRGVFNDHDFRGTYLVSRPSEPVQYVKFQLAPDASPPSANSAK